MPLILVDLTCLFDFLTFISLNELLFNMEKYVDVKDEEFRKRIKQRVDEYLDGAWNEVDQNDIIIKRITYIILI